MQGIKDDNFAVMCLVIIRTRLEKLSFLPLRKFCRSVLSLPASVRLSVRRWMLVRTITREVFQLESPNLHRMWILGPSRTPLKMESIDLDLQGHFGLLLTNFRKMELVRTISRQGFEPESPNSHSICFLGPFRRL